MTHPNSIEEKKVEGDREKRKKEKEKDKKSTLIFLGRKGLS